MNIKEEDKVLEIGCGVGDLSHELSTKSIHTIGVDISVRHAKLRFRTIDFMKVSGEYLSFKNNSFDKIICINVIEHLKYPHKLLTEIKRILKPEGKVLLQTPDINFFLHSMNYDETHMHEWTQKEFKYFVDRYFYTTLLNPPSSMFKYYPFNLILSHIIKPDITLLGVKHN